MFNAIKILIATKPIQVIATTPERRPSRPSRRAAMAIRSHSSAPVAAPASNSLKEKPCPVLPFWSRL